MHTRNLHVSQVIYLEILKEDESKNRGQKNDNKIGCYVSPSHEAIIENNYVSYWNAATDEYVAINSKDKEQ